MLFVFSSDAMLLWTRSDDSRIFKLPVNYGQMCSNGPRDVNYYFWTGLISSARDGATRCVFVCESGSVVVPLLIDPQ